jgi:hypothetical protein
LREILIAAVLIAQVVSASTKVVLFDPSTLTGIHEIASFGGSCTASPIGTERRKAYRCFAGDHVFDPCFANASASVVCPTDIFGMKGVEVKVGKPLPAMPPVPSKYEPWAMLLASDIHCQLATTVRPRGFPFYCSGDKPLCAVPDLAKVAEAYFVRCGRPIADGISDESSILVKIAYR